MNLRTVAIGVVVLIVAGYVLLDGVRQLSGKGYLAPGGRLGPWAGLIRRLGIDPRATGVAAVFVIYGVVLLCAFGLYLTGSVPGAVILIAAAVLGLWYLPFGTIGCLVIAGLAVWDLATR